MAYTYQLLEQLEDVVEQYQRLGAAIDNLVLQALRAGASYQDIASRLGYTRQRVHQLYSDRV
jgi:hypothetical protein